MDRAAHEALCRHYGMAATRNNRGLAHESRAIEGPHGHLRRAIADALLLRGSAEFEDLAAYRRFLDELVGRRNARLAKRIERAAPRRAAPAAAAPRMARRPSSPSPPRAASRLAQGVLLRALARSPRVSSRWRPRGLAGHRLRVRIHDDRLELFLGATHLLTLPRGRSRGDGRHGHVVDHRRVVHALRRKPMALPGLIHRDQPLPREACRRLFEAAMAALPARRACRLTIDALLLAHERGCEAELAGVIAEALDEGAPPDIAGLRRRFAPDPSALPEIAIPLAPLSDYDALMAAPVEGGAAA